jgi:hypothetical protein
LSRNGGGKTEVGMGEEGERIEVKETERDVTGD